MGVFFADAPCVVPRRITAFLPGGQPHDGRAGGFQLLLHAADLLQVEREMLAGAPVEEGRHRRAVGLAPAGGTGLPVSEAIAGMQWR